MSRRLISKVCTVCHKPFIAKGRRYKVTCSPSCAFKSTILNAAFIFFRSEPHKSEILKSLDGLQYAERYFKRRLNAS